MMTNKKIYPIGLLLMVITMGMVGSPVMAAKLQEKTLTA